MARRRLATALGLPLAAAALALLPTAAASAATTDFSANATSANESKPGPAGASAHGTFTVESGQVCYTVTATGLDDAVAMHIHKGAAGVDGGIVIPLDQKKIGAGKTCTKAAAAVLSQVQANPAGFYLNVHTPAFPAGAVRGQLVAASSSSSSSAPSSVNAGSGGAADDSGLPVLPVTLLVLGLAVVGTAGWRLARR
jgi:hypothetical protein